MKNQHRSIVCRTRNFPNRFKNIEKPGFLPASAVALIFAASFFFAGACLFGAGFFFAAGFFLAADFFAVGFFLAEACLFAAGFFFVVGFFLADFVRAMRRIVRQPSGSRLNEAQEIGLRAPRR